MPEQSVQPDLPTISFLITANPSGEIQFQSQPPINLMQAADLLQGALRRILLQIGEAAYQAGQAAAVNGEAAPVAQQPVRVQAVRAADVGVNLTRAPEAAKQ